ncbi:MAG: RnfABCDGE type electron transport complex subunit D [Clostridia bacterium]|nr:RnfABCDGE type electron transport complex subunit D [Clostridia bacterium]
MKLSVSSSPHLRAPVTTERIMRDVLISLLPCVAAGVWLFGLRTLLVVGISTLLCMFLEFTCRFIMKREQTVGDLSAAVTGVLLGLTLPVSIPIPLIIVGCVTAIVVVKQMFGGLGNNFVNPALAGRIVMLVSFPTQMTGFTTPTWVDAVTTATPLAPNAEAASLLDLFLGRVGGCIGETCKIAILLGLAYLLIRRVISPIIPLCYVGTVALFSLAVGADALFQLLSGGLLFGAVFMATDYVTSPVGKWGKVVYAVGCGLITVLIRLYASLPEGVSYAIVLMNILCPLIERIPFGKTFGKGKSKEGKTV